MGVAESMKGLTSDILASYDVRVKALGDMSADTHKILADARKAIKGFAGDRKKMSAEQAESLSDFLKDLNKGVSGLLKEFSNNRKSVSEEQVKIFEEQAKSLIDFSKNLNKDVTTLLHGFAKDRSKTSAALRDKLSKEIKDIKSAAENIVDNAQTLIKEYRSDLAKAKNTWQGMSATLAQAKRKGVMPRIEAGEKVATVEEAVAKRKGKKRGRKAKRGRR